MSEFIKCKDCGREVEVVTTELDGEVDRRAVCPEDGIITRPDA